MLQSSNNAYINSISPESIPEPDTTSQAWWGTSLCSTIDLSTCGVYTSIKLLKSIDLPTIMLTISVQSHTRTCLTYSTFSIHIFATNNPTLWIAFSHGLSKKLILTHPSFYHPPLPIHFPKDNKSSDTVSQPYPRLRYPNAMLELSKMRWGLTK